MERYHIDAIRAFELLARLSQEANTKLADIRASSSNTTTPRPDPAQTHARTSATAVRNASARC